MPDKLLIVEDDDSLRTGLELYFRSEGFVVLTSARGDEAVPITLREQPAVIILDVMLPGMDGFEICRELRRIGVTTPVLFLTCRIDEVDRVVGFEIGGDDYVVKPFSSRELLARVKTRLRRAPEEDRTILRLDDLAVDIARKRVLRSNKRVKLTSREFELLRYLALRRGETISRSDLLFAVWGYKRCMLSRTVDTHVRNLRRKLERDPADPQHILSVHGEGYRVV